MGPSLPTAAPSLVVCRTVCSALPRLRSAAAASIRKLGVRRSRTPRHGPTSAPRQDERTGNDGAVGQSAEEFAGLADQALGRAGGGLCGPASRQGPPRRRDRRPSSGAGPRGGDPLAPPRAGPLTGGVSGRDGREPRGRSALRPRHPGGRDHGGSQGLIRIPGVNTTTKTNKRTRKATRTYHHRKAGRRHPDDPEAVEFRLAVARFDATPIGTSPDDTTFKVLVQKYLASTDFAELADTTKAEYRRHITYIEPVPSPFLVRAIRPAHVEGIKRTFAKAPSPGRRVRCARRQAVRPARRRRGRAGGAGVASDSRSIHSPG